MNQPQTMFSFIIAWIFLLLCIFGLISNLLSVIVYSHPTMRAPINVLLAGLSTIDLVLCLLAVGAFCIPELSMYYEVLNPFSFKPLQVAYAATRVYPCTMVVQTCSVWTFVVISFERFVAVCWPFRARWCTIGRSVRALATVAVLALLYNIPRFFEYAVRYDPQGKIYAKYHLRNATLHPTYMTVYYCGCYLLTHFAIPFSFLLIANTFMILAVCKAHRQRRLLSQQEKREHKMAFMMILVVCEFVFCNTLPFVLNIVELLEPSFFLSGDTQFLAWALNNVNNLLVIFNASTTAVIYASCSERYRRMLFTLWMNLRSFRCLSKTNDRAAFDKAIFRELPMERGLNFNANENALGRRAIRPWTQETPQSDPVSGRELLLSATGRGCATEAPSGRQQEARDPAECDGLGGREMSQDIFVSAPELCEIPAESLN